MAILDRPPRRRQLPSAPPARAALQALARDLLTSFDTNDPAVVVRCARRFLAAQRTIDPAPETRPATARPPALRAR
jgi:hypothetical protein